MDNVASRKKTFRLNCKSNKELGGKKKLSMNAVFGIEACLEGVSSVITL